MGHEETARSNHRSGYNCAQSVFVAFADQLGVSPIDYVNYYRIECASHFLTSTDMTIAEIAQHCGYNDSSFFIKQFKKYKGTTPKRYRAL